MILEHGCNELRELISDLKENGCIGLKMSTEDGGHSIDFIDFVNNRLLNDVVPLNMKIGGPDAQTDIKEALRIGVAGIIAPMVESPFGISKFVTALRTLAGEETMRRRLVSVNLESVTAYRQIDEILRTPEIEAIDQIIIGTTDLARSVSKPKTDSTVITMVKEMAQKAKREGKIVRIGGLMSFLHNNQAVFSRLLDETGADKVNTSNVCFRVNKIPNLPAAYSKALTFEQKLFALWLAIQRTSLAPLQDKVSNLEKRIAQ